MYVYFIYFFEKSAEVEHTINRLRVDLQGADFDEFHFRSTDKYENESWKSVAAKQIKSCDFVVFLYTDSDKAERNVSNVSFELDAAYKEKKTVFFIPIPPGRPGVAEGLDPDRSDTPRLDKYKGVDGCVVVTDIEGLVGYINHARGSRDSSIPRNMEEFD